MVSNTAVTSGDFSLNDLPGAGRMDVVCRCVNSGLLLSHGIRKNTRMLLLLLGPPTPPKLIRIDGDSVKYLGPDERNIGGLLKKALGQEISSECVRSSPGISVSKKTFEEVMKDVYETHSQVLYLHESGNDVRKMNFFKDVCFILGDQMGLTEEQERIVEKYTHGKMCVSPLSLHGDHCITIVHNELDRREVLC